MNILLPLVDGFEDIEAVSVIDVLRRAGLQVVTTGLQGTIVHSAHGIKLTADKKLEDVDPDSFDALVLVGGPGYQNLSKSKRLMSIVLKYNEEKKTIGAICAAPLILANLGILDDRKATIYPGMERQISRPRDGKVVVDEHIITSQGPGTAVEFALSLVEKFRGKSEADSVRKSLVA